MTNTFKITGALIGAKLDTTSTDAKYALGTRAFGNNDTEWCYVLSSGAIRQYDCVAIDEAFTASSVTLALATQGHSPGFAQVAFATAEYGWVALSGGGALKVRTASSTVKDSPLYVGASGASAGIVQSVSGTGRLLLNGVVTVATAASAAVYPVIIASNPWFTAA